MKFMVCIPVEVECETTKRTEIKEAVRRKLLETTGEGPGLMALLPSLRIGRFLVRAPEKIPGHED